MRKYLLTLACAALLGGQASASQPGEPLDCSDIAVLEPGLTCTHYSDGFLGWQGSGVDNQGRVLIAQDYHGPVVDTCGGFSMNTIALLNDATTGIPVEGSPDVAATTLLKFDERCSDNGAGEWDTLKAEFDGFDAVNGILYLGMTSSCGRCQYAPGEQSIGWTAKIEGFPTLADVLAPGGLVTPAEFQALQDEV